MEGKIWPLCNSRKLEQKPEGAREECHCVLGVQCGDWLGVYRPGCSSPAMFSIHYASSLLETPHGSFYRYINSKSLLSDRLWSGIWLCSKDSLPLPILFKITFLLYLEKNQVYNHHRTFALAIPSVWNLYPWIFVRSFSSSFTSQFKQLHRGLP